jgi:hypothetical protein
LREFREQGKIAFIQENVLPVGISEIKIEKVRIIIAMLDANGVIENLSYSEQEQLIKNIAEIVTFGE